MKRALAYPVALIAFGLVTGAPALFNTLGLCLYVALVRECGRYVIPWPGVRRWLRLEPLGARSTNTPPLSGTPLSNTNTQVSEVGTAGYVVYPAGERVTYAVTRKEQHT